MNGILGCIVGFSPGKYCALRLIFSCCAESRGSMDGWKDVWRWTWRFIIPIPETKRHNRSCREVPLCHKQASRSLAIDMIQHEHDMTCHHVHNPELCCGGKKGIRILCQKGLLNPASMISERAFARQRRNNLVGFSHFDTVSYRKA